MPRSSSCKAGYLFSKIILLPDTLRDLLVAVTPRFETDKDQMDSGFLPHNDSVRSLPISARYKASMNA